MQAIFIISLTSYFLYMNLQERKKLWARFNRFVEFFVLMLKLEIIIKYRQFKRIQPYCPIKIIDYIIGMGPMKVLLIITFQGKKDKSELI